MDVLGVIIGATALSVTLTWTLLSLAAPFLWLWMLIDSLFREEREYPGATETSNNKLLWVLLIVLTQIAAIPYFFMVFSKIRRGTLPRPVPVAIEPVAA